MLILDVDGVMTDGSLPYSENGNSWKSFYVQDGGALRIWQDNGGLAAIISGRQCPGVGVRARDLGIRIVHEGVAAKLPVYRDICRESDLGDDDVCVMGDDLLDLPIMTQCGYPIAVANAVPMVKRAARYVTRLPGGRGAIREAVERLMRRNGTWSGAVERWSPA